MKKHVLCLGDSNTHGYCADPTDCSVNISRKAAMISPLPCNPFR